MSAAKGSFNVMLIRRIFLGGILPKSVVTKYKMVSRENFHVDLRTVRALFLFKLYCDINI